MHLVDRSFKELVAMTAKTPPELGGSTAALLSSLLGIAMSKMALLTSIKKHFDNDLIVARLDAIAMDIASALERDQKSVKQLINSLKDDATPEVKRSALIEATHQPLAASHLLIDAMEVLVSSRGKVDQSVTSDYYGGATVIAASFRAVVMATNANLEATSLAEIKQRTSKARSELQARFERATEKLGLLSRE